MQMQMLGDPGTGGPAKIHTQVVALWMVILRQSYLDALRQLHHFGERFRISGGKLRYVRIRHDHYVTASVGVEIQNYEAFGAAKNNQKLRVIICRNRVAKNTAVVL